MLVCHEQASFVCAVLCSDDCVHVQTPQLSASEQFNLSSKVCL